MPLAAFGFLVYLTFRRKVGKYHREIIAFLVIFLLSVLLSLGSYTPLKVLFKFPPFSFTRVESRFLAFSSVSFGLLSGLGIDILIKHRGRRIALMISLMILVFHALQLAWTFKSYHVFVDSNEWLTKPRITKLLPDEVRVISFNQEVRWNDALPKNGWFGKEPLLLNGLNSMGPNLNLVFGIKQLGVYAQQLPKRQEMIQRNMYRDDILGRNIRDVFGVSDMIDAKNDFEIIENKTALADIRIGQNIIKVRDIGESLGRMNQESFSPTSDVLWESETMPREDEEVVVANRSYYPGWKAFLSGKEILIYPVNINQQAVIVPKETEISKLAFKYDPWSYKIGGAISGVSLISWLMFLRRFSVQ